MVPKFIEVVRVEEIDPIMINVDHIVRIESHKRGCKLIMSGNFPDITIQQDYVTLFEELQ